MKGCCCILCWFELIVNNLEFMICHYWFGINKENYQTIEFSITWIPDVQLNCSERYGFIKTSLMQIV